MQTGMTGAAGDTIEEINAKNGIVILTTGVCTVGHTHMGIIAAQRGVGHPAVRVVETGRSAMIMVRIMKGHLVHHLLPAINAKQLNTKYSSTN